MRRDKEKLITFYENKLIEEKKKRKVKKYENILTELYKNYVYIQ